MPLRHHSQRTGRARKPSERRQESSAIDHGVPLRATCADSTRELRPQQQTFIPYPRFSESASTACANKRSEEHTSELQSRLHLVCRLLLEKKKKKKNQERLHSRTM